MTDLTSPETSSDDVRLDADLLTAARANAEKGCVSVSDYLNRVLREALHLKPADADVNNGRAGKGGSGAVGG